MSALPSAAAAREKGTVSEEPGSGNTNAKEMPQPRTAVDMAVDTAVDTQAGESAVRRQTSVGVNVCPSNSVCVFVTRAEWYASSRDFCRAAPRVISCGQQVASDTAAPQQKAGFRVLKQRLSSLKTPPVLVRPADPQTHTRRSAKLKRWHAGSVVQRLPDRFGLQTPAETHSTEPRQDRVLPAPVGAVGGVALGREARRGAIERSHSTRPKEYAIERSTLSRGAALSRGVLHRAAPRPAHVRG